MPALRVVTQLSREGPSPLSAEPVVAHLLAWDGSEPPPDAQELLTRVPRFSPLLALAPQVAAGKHRLETLGSAIASLARHLLDPNGGLLKTAHVLQLEEARILVVVAVHDTQLGHRALALAAALLGAAGSPRDLATASTLHARVEALLADAARLHPDDDHRVLLAGARSLGLPVVRTPGSAQLQFGWGIHSCMLDDLVSRSKGSDPPAAAGQELLVIDGRLAAATALREAAEPRDVLHRVHPRVREWCEHAARQSGGRVAAFTCRDGDVTHPDAVERIAPAQGPSLGLHARGGRDPAALGSALLAGSADRIPAVLAIGPHETLVTIARAWLREARRLGIEGAGVAMRGFSAVDDQARAPSDDLHERTRALLADRTCRSILIGASSSELLDTGLPLDVADACVIVGQPRDPVKAEQLMQLLQQRNAARITVRPEGLPQALAAIAGAVVAPRPAPAVNAAPTPAALPGDTRFVRRRDITDGPTILTMMRNEAYLLPHFLAHYRRLGVENFIVWDDSSDDGSREMLEREPDCSILESSLQFNERMPDGRTFHHLLREAVPESLGPGRWVLSVDLDEFLVLPAMFDGLAPFQGELDRLGHDCIFGTMVDTYPTTLAARNHPLSTSPLEGAPWFDIERGFRRRLFGPPEKVLGGIRGRLVERLRREHPQVHQSIFGGRGYLMPALYKVPLAKTGCGITRHNSHTVNRQPPQGIELALAHFKFGPDLDAKLHEALKMRQHYLGSIEYRFLDAAVRLLGQHDLRYEGTRSLADPGSLEAAGLVRFDP